MSVVKANSHQIGQSLTASQNFTWYQPATPDGTVRLGNGNSGSVTDLVTLTSAGNLGIGTTAPAVPLQVTGEIRIYPSSGTGNLRFGSGGVEKGKLLVDSSSNMGFETAGTQRMTLDSSGNLGLGVTPSGWRTDVSFKALQMPGGTFAAYVAGGLDPTPNISANAYVDSGGTWRYLNSRAASWYIQNGGMHAWYTAPSGTAGNAISFTQAMTLDASGALSNVAYVKAGTYLWAAGDTSSGGIYLGSAGANNARIGQNSFGTGTTTTYIGNAAITTSSDVRLKENIEDTKRNAIEILGNLRVVDHTWNDPTDTCENNRNSRGVWMGLIAQEAINHIPWLVNKPLSDEDERGNPQYWHMDYGYSVPLLVKAIQELSAELNELKQKVNA